MPNSGKPGANPEQLFAAGYAAFAGGMATGRFSGDFIRLRVSAVRIVRWGGLLAAAGLVLATLSSDVYVSIVGFAIAGLGISMKATALPVDRKSVV